MRRVTFCLVAMVASVLSGGCAGTYQAELLSARKHGKPIFISRLQPHHPARSGEIGVSVQFFNTSGKTYKYVDISVEAYNRVGDAIRHHDPRYSTIAKLRFTGPLLPRRTPGTTLWPQVWYSGTVSCVAIRRIDITHMDLTKHTIEAPALAGILAPAVPQNCPTA